MTASIFATASLRMSLALPGRIDSVTVARPSLEDVFLRRTGHHLFTEEEAAA